MALEWHPQAILVLTFNIRISQNINVRFVMENSVTIDVNGKI